MTVTAELGQFFLHVLGCYRPSKSKHYVIFIYIVRYNQNCLSKQQWQGKKFLLIGRNIGPDQVRSISVISVKFWISFNFIDAAVGWIIWWTYLFFSTLLCKNSRDHSTTPQTHISSSIFFLPYHQGDRVFRVDPQSPVKINILLL